MRDPAAAEHPPSGGSMAGLSMTWFVVRQFLLVAGAVVAYFGVRGITEGSVGAAMDNARGVLDLERSIGVAIEESLQDALDGHDALITLANWVYIWCHWPLVIATLVWFLVRHRSAYLELRNAMFVSGAIGLVIYATFPVSPPRLYGSEYVDTVTERSNSYRVLQPPGFVNAYAAVPSLHFGWNLLVGIAWFRVGRAWWWRAAGVVMPIAMAWAVVATGNHWVVDVVAGGIVALAGLVIVLVLERGVEQRAGGQAARRTWPSSYRQPAAQEEQRNTTSPAARSMRNPMPSQRGHDPNGTAASDEVPGDPVGDPEAGR